MTNSMTSQIDSARAKKAARTIQTRLKALGQTICLNHAYEAVAAVADYPTWAIMKAALDAGEAAVIRNSEKVPDWLPFRIDENNPAVLVYGPDDERRAAVIAFLLREHADRTGTGGALHAICAGTPNPHLVSVARSTRKSGSVAEEVIATLENSHRAVLNIFDLPPGRMVPTDAHKARIIAFLDEVTEQGLGALSDKFLPIVVDAAYAMATGSGAEASHRVYERGMRADIDAVMDREWGVNLTPPIRTWIDVSKALTLSGEHALAAAAMAHAVPRLDTLIACSRNPEIMDRFSNFTVSDERVPDAFCRLASQAIREFAFLQVPSNVRVAQGASPILFGIECPSVEAGNLLSIVARNAIDLATDGTSRAGFSIVIDPDIIPRNASVECHRQVYQSIKSGIPIIVMTASTEIAESIYELVSSVFVTGFDKRVRVGDLCGILDLDENTAEEMHAKLFQASGRNDITSALAIVKRWMRRKTAFVEFPAPVPHGPPGSDDEKQPPATKDIGDYLSTLDKSPYELKGSERQVVDGVSTLKGSWRLANS